MARILVIDDEESICNLFKKLLTGAGYEVLTALNGKEAIDLCNEIFFDLIITDIFMPEVDGLEFIREIRSSRPSAKIIAISGGSPRINSDYLKVAILMGADYSFHKPFNNEKILTTVNNILTHDLK